MKYIDLEIIKKYLNTLHIFVATEIMFLIAPKYYIKS